MNYSVGPKRHAGNSTLSLLRLSTRHLRGFDALIVASSVVLAASQSVAQTTSWTAGSGDWHLGDKWSLGIPSSSVDAAIANDGVVQLLFSGISRDLTLGGGNQSGSLEISTGSLPVTLTTTRDAFIGSNGGFGDVSLSNGGSKWNVTGQVNIGATASGTLTISAGATVTSGDGAIAASSGTSGAAIVTGIGSKWQNNGPFYAAYLGVGMAEVSNGGVLSNTQGEIGSQTGSNGTVSVAGFDSRWINSGNLFVGAKGSGALNITAGGKVSTSSVAVANDLGSIGTILGDGQGTSLSASGNLLLGVGGTGSLTATNGAQVNSVNVDLGVLSGSKGIAHLSGAGSAWTSTGTSFTIGNSGQGILSIESGARLRSSLGVVGDAGTAEGTATIKGAGSSWSNTQSLYVGYQGKGVVTVANGGMISNTSGLLGDDIGSSGVLKVMDAGSNWTNSGGLVVGNAGQGTLELKNGGTTTSTFGTIASRSGSIGKVTIDGEHSKWTLSSSSLVIGHGGYGSLTVVNGGRLESPFAAIGYDAGSVGEVTIDGAGSTWICNDSLFVANSGKGSLTLKNGGQLFVLDDSGMGVGTQGIFGGTGTVTVATLLNEGLVNVGDGVGTLSVVGNYAQVNGGGLHFEIESANSYDRLIVSGSMSLAGGALGISFGDGYVPSAGQAFDIMDWGSRAGTIDILNVPALTPHLAWDASRLLSDGIISIRSLVQLPGDYNNDSHVDGVDFLVWQRQFGSSVTALSGADGNGNGVVDAADLGIWRNNFGTSGSASAATAVTPEPGTAFLTLVASSALLHVSRFLRRQ